MLALFCRLRDKLHYTQRFVFAVQPVMFHDILVQSLGGDDRIDAAIQPVSFALLGKRQMSWVSKLSSVAFSLLIYRSPGSIKSKVSIQFRFNQAIKLL